jgi:hypothetical protein
LRRSEGSVWMKESSWDLSFIKSHFERMFRAGISIWFIVERALNGFYISDAEMYFEVSERKVQSIKYIPQML